MDQPNYVIPFEKLSIGDIGIVGGKNASLSETIQALSPKGVRIPPGFAVSAQAYRAFLDHNNLVPVITGLLNERKGGMPLNVMGAAIRTAIAAGSYPQTLKDQISEAYSALSAQHNEKAVDVAVRSSATAEDLPEARFAGQQESFLNVQGADALLEATRQCFASLFTDRAIIYREHNGFEHMDVALSVGVQLMASMTNAGMVSDRPGADDTDRLDSGQLETGSNKTSVDVGIQEMSQRKKSRDWETDYGFLGRQILNDLDWVPLKRSSGIITDHGGRTSYAAIISRELSIAAKANAARTVLKEGQEVRTPAPTLREGNPTQVFSAELEELVATMLANSPATRPEQIAGSDSSELLVLEHNTNEISDSSECEFHATPARLESGSFLVSSARDATGPKAAIFKRTPSKSVCAPW